MLGGLTVARAASSTSDSAFCSTHEATKVEWWLSGDHHDCTVHSSGAPQAHILQVLVNLGCNNQLSVSLQFRVSVSKHDLLRTCYELF